MPRPAPSSLYLLKVLSPDGASVRSFHLGEGEHLVGSAADAAVPLDEPGVSRRHALLTVLPDGGVVVADLGSKNGTSVAGRRVRATAVREFAVLSFGPVQAILQATSAESSQTLFAAPGPVLGESGGAAGEPGPSTEGAQPLEKLAESLTERIGPLFDGSLTPEAAADHLAHAWLGSLGVTRVELLRLADSGDETVVAAASTAAPAPERERPPQPSSAAGGLSITGPDGWRLRLRAGQGEPLARFAPLFRLALELLAAAAWRAPARRGAPAPSLSEPAPTAGAPPGLSPAMARLYRRAGKVARGDVPVLLLGESGVGKEVLARHVHACSRRARGPFLAVNCAALPRDLLEAELFGIERGVATGVEPRPGLLERGSGGTVFLDEVGDMAPETQAKVLRVLENTSLYRVGGRTPVAIDVRFVAATNRDLAAMVEAGTFRRDLYHRLAAFECRIPPLRERREEVPGLAARFFHRELGKAGITSPGLTRAALAALVAHPWPGNVRELENEVAQAVLLLERGEPLDVHHLSARVRAGSAPGTAADLTLEAAVGRAEREAFAVALAAAQGDPGQAMDLLGLSRTTYYRKMKELGLSAPESGTPDPGPAAQSPGNGTPKSR